MNAGKVAKAIAGMTMDSASRERLHEIISILNKHHILRNPTPQAVKEVLEDLGPTFVKLGQMISSHAEIFPADYCEAFASLRSQTMPLSFEEVERLLDAAYQGDYHTVFSDVEKKPLGSASIAQVHRAKLVDGETVAVKIQRAGIKPLIRDDIVLLRKANDLLEISDQVGSDFDATVFVDELDRTVNEEIDFNIETRNLQEFYDNNLERRGISSPRVYEEYSSETTLVMEYIDGLSFEHLDEMRDTRSESDLRRLGRRIVSNYMAQMLEDGLFHADPHPANLMLCDDEVVWIDLGMVGRLGEGERGMLRQLFLSIAIGDASGLKRTLLTWGHPTGSIDHPKLLRDLDAIVARYGRRDIADLDLTNGLNDLLDILRGQHIAMPGSFTMLARGLMTLQGTVQDINPSINILETLSSYLQKTMLQDIDFRKLLQQVAAESYHNADRVMKVPQQAFNVLDMLEKGETHVNIGMKDIDEPIAALKRTIERATLGVITAGLFIGSSLLCTTNMEPQVLGIPIIGFFGYVCAFFISVYIVWKVHSNEKSKKKNRW